MENMLPCPTGPTSYSEQIDNMANEIYTLNVAVRDLWTLIFGEPLLADDNRWDGAELIAQIKREMVSADLAALRAQNEGLKKLLAESSRTISSLAEQQAMPDDFYRVTLQNISDALAANSSPRAKEGKRIFEPNTAAAYLQATGKRPEDDVEAFDKWWPGWQAEQPTRD